LSMWSRDRERAVSGMSARPAYAVVGRTRTGLCRGVTGVAG
jgi:hypothetical protein